jgi:hypothetical protein
MSAASVARMTFTPAQALAPRVGVAAEELRRLLVACREPALMRGLLRARAPSWRWSPEELLRRLTARPGGATQRTRALAPRPSGVNYVSQHRSEPVEMLVRDALVRVAGGVGEPLQCRLDPSLFWQDHEELPALLRDRRVRVHLDNSFVWLTSPGLRTSLHVSPSHLRTRCVSASSGRPARLLAQLTHTFSNYGTTTIC